MSGAPGFVDPVRDEELRAMLAARADRVAPSLEREVMAAVRREISGSEPVTVSRDGAGFGVRPVVRAPSPAPRRRPLLAGAAVLGMAAVVAVAVLGSSLVAGRHDPSPGAASPGASAGVGSTASASASVVPGASEVAVPPADGAPSWAGSVLPFEQLRTALEAGDLDGQLVIVNDSIDVVPCGPIVRVDCYSWRLRGLDGVEIGSGAVPSPAKAAELAAGASPTWPVALVGTGKSLSFVGWLDPEHLAPITLPALHAAPPEAQDGRLAVVSGWLLGNLPPTPCPSRNEAQCPDPGPVLADAVLPRDGQAGSGYSWTPVWVSDRVSRQLRDARTELEGPFLVGATGTTFAFDPPEFTVMERISPGTTIWVPPPETPPAPVDSAARRSVDELHAALADGSLDGRIVLVKGTLKLVAYGCETATQEPCTRYFIPGIDGVEVRWSGPIQVRNDTSSGVAPSPAPDPSGVIAVTPRDGHLDLLGILRGRDETPGSIRDVFYRRGRWTMDPLALDPVAGWLLSEHGGLRLVGTEPAADGSVPAGTTSVDVAVSYGPGLEPGLKVQPGPFLVRQTQASVCGGESTQSPSLDCYTVLRFANTVVARYDLASVVAVTIP